MPGIFDEEEQPKNEVEMIRPVDYEPESAGENARRSGLAYSAGIVFFASVAFMLLLGWGADLLFGTSPWGLVGGIVLGSIIGFAQFFRITSRIFSSKSDGPAVHPLMPTDQNRDDSDRL
jgi:F0F1-type ATP synthase assembly protein I